MDPLSLMIYIAIGNMVAWLAALYVKGALPGLIGHVIVSTLGAAGTAYLILRFAPAVNGIGIVGGALVGAAVLLYVTISGSWAEVGQRRGARDNADAACSIAEQTGRGGEKFLWSFMDKSRHRGSDRPVD